MKSLKTIALVLLLAGILTGCGGGGGGDETSVVDDNSPGNDNPVTITNTVIPSSIVSEDDFTVSYNVKDGDNVDHTVVGVYTKAGNKVDEVDLYPSAATTSFDVSNVFSGLTEGEYTVNIKAYGIDGGSGYNSYAELTSTLLVSLEGALNPTPIPSSGSSIVLKTGQLVSYDANGFKETEDSLKDDGFYRAGAVRSYIRDDTTGIVTDNTTGLMWQDDVEAVVKQWVTYENYVDMDFTNTSGDTATTYCEDLTLGDFQDWHLPTASQLESLIDYGRVMPAIDPVFSNTFEEAYWTSQSRLQGGTVWVVDFQFGLIRSIPVNDNAYIRCVREK